MDFLSVSPCSLKEKRALGFTDLSVAGKIWVSLVQNWE